MTASTTAWGRPAPRRARPTPRASWAGSTRSSSCAPRWTITSRACREHLSDHDWVLGVCPFCGAPPRFSDVADDGRRRLACHLCGAAAWIFTRLRCPFCGNEDTKDLGRLDFEAAADQGYFISTCTQCRAYLKEVDRRVRWNAGPALVEDWGSPHFDLVAAGAGYWRPAAPVILHRPLS